MDNSFHQFGVLPKELRLQVWEAALEPQLLRVSIGGTAITAVADWTVNGNPVALSVCAESREVALKRYTLTIPIFQFHENSAFRFAKRYIDPETDLLFIEPQVKSKPPSNLSQINEDFIRLRSYFEVAELVASEWQGRTRIPLRRMAVSQWWWLTRWDPVEHQGGFSHRCFDEMHEIFIIPDADDEQSYQPDEPHESSEQRSRLETLLPVKTYEFLRRMGFGVDEEREALKVTMLDTGTSTRIQHGLPVPFDQIDMTAQKPPSNDDFFSKAPDVQYPRASVP
ncbi:hypothetical protein F4777DRAFT_422799 [Nemania sp. FL0916]|nr:hypothetical protein F4777DRAFT_422799 [Nemania sp. FL0916]